MSRIEFYFDTKKEKYLCLSIASLVCSEKAKEINKFIKGLGLKGIQSQTQGDQVRVSGKKRDDLQHIITELKGNDFGIPLQYGNFRD